VKAEWNSHVSKRDLTTCIFQTNILVLRCLPVRLWESLETVWGFFKLKTKNKNNPPPLFFYTGKPVPTRRREGKLVKITGARQSWKGPGARLCFICVCVSRLFHYLLIVKVNLLRPSRSHCTTERQSLRVCVKIFSQSALAGARGGGQKSFPPPPGPERNLGGPKENFAKPTNERLNYFTSHTFSHLRVNLTMGALALLGCYAA